MIQCGDGAGQVAWKFHVTTVSLKGTEEYITNRFTKFVKEGHYHQHGEALLGNSDPYELV
jgi:hypothetical protein